MTTPPDAINLAALPECKQREVIVAWDKNGTVYVWRTVSGEYWIRYTHSPDVCRYLEVVGWALVLG